MKNSLLNITQEIAQVGTECFEDYSFVENNKEKINELFSLASYHRVFNLTYHFLERNLNKIPDMIEEKHREQLVKIDYVKRELVNTCRFLNELRMPYVILKGIPQSLLLFNDANLRDCGDIDLAVPVSEFENVYKLLLEFGYKQLGNNTDTLQYNYGPYFHEINLYKVIDYGGAEKKVPLELKKASSAIKYKFNLLYDNTQDLMIDSVPIKTLNNDATVLHLFCNAFTNNESKFIWNKSRLREYFEVAFALKHFRFNWDNVYDLSIQMENCHTIYDVLRSVTGLYDLSEQVTEDNIVKFSPGNCSYKLTTDYLISDREGHYNAGLLVRENKLPAEFRIFNKDYAYHEFVKFYKAIEYSNKNSRYTERIKIRKGTHADLQMFTYTEERFGTHFNYGFSASDTHFTVRYYTTLDTYRNIQNNNLFFRMMWICNDLSDCALITYIDIDALEIKPEIIESHTNIVIKKEYESGSIFSDYILNKETSYRKVTVNMRSTQDYVEIVANLPYHFIMETTDVIAIDMKLMLKQSTGPYSLKAIPHVIEVEK